MSTAARPRRRPRRSSRLISVLRIAVPLAWVLLLVNGGEEAAAIPLGDIQLVPVLESAFSQANGIANAGDGTDRLFVIQQTGQILVVDADRTGASMFLDLSSLVSLGAERGLLGIAFHPEFASNGRFFVDYTDVNGDTVVAEYAAPPGSAVAAPEEVRRILFIEQPQEFHNGGALVFGPDGYLYVGMGDGGWPEDQLGTSQDTSRLLGGILRIDVDGGDPYAVPPDNPFVDGGGRPELWLYGLRNPWRIAFDSENGDLWIGDVGQLTHEEINVFRAGWEAPANYGWSVTEGYECFLGTSCDPSQFEPPVTTYGGRRLRTGNCAVIGGQVARDRTDPGLWGRYFYGDFCSGRIWSLATSDAEDGPVLDLDTSIVPTAFGFDEAGHLLVVDYAGGTLYRIVSRTVPS